SRRGSNRSSGRKVDSTKHRKDLVMAQQAMQKANTLEQRLNKAAVQPERAKFAAARKRDSVRMQKTMARAQKAIEKAKRMEKRQDSLRDAREKYREQHRETQKKPDSIRDFNRSSGRKVDSTKHREYMVIAQQAMQKADALEQRLNKAAVQPERAKFAAARKRDSV